MRPARTTTAAPSPCRCCWPPRCPAWPPPSGSTRAWPVAYTQYCTVLYCTVLYRQDSGVAYSDYGAAFARFVETQHRRLYTTQAAAWLDHPQLADIRRVPRLSHSEDALTL